jgi:1-deoxy-D-xylulose-5-phosphate synthase
MKIEPGNLLKQINNPSDLKKFDISDLGNISEQLRQYIIDVVSQNGGHFAASLGVVELTVALHYVFNSPIDNIVWDVGHQAYGHKILTGRREEFLTNRQFGGISGFPNMAESEYDAFGVGHSSTSISAALGMAMGEKFNKTNGKNIAIIGDGSMTGGMAFEALNNAGVSNSDILVILNDNKIAIDPIVGALSEYLIDFTTSRLYNKMKDDVWNMFGRLRMVGSKSRKIISKVEGSLKSFLLRQSNMFEALQFRYFGTIDGHDISKLVSVLSDLQNIKGPKILHIQTIKGKGYLPAEKDQTKWHATNGFNKITGCSIKTSNNNLPPKYQDVFGKTIVELANKNKNIIGITPAMPSGSSLNIMMKEIPDRAFDVGIAEQHAVTFAAGLATKGLIPFCNIYSSFSQRAYDQIIHDVCLQKLQVIMCLDRAGIVGEDGATHHGNFDISFLRPIPNITIIAPMNEIELRNAMFTAQDKNIGAVAIRYPRGRGVISNWQKPMKSIPIGKGRKISKLP